jgi:hypothetical protein
MQWIMPTLFFGRGPELAPRRAAKANESFSFLVTRRVKVVPSGFLIVTKSNVN